MRNLFSLITIAGFVLAVVSFVGQYRCSRDGEWCVVSPTPREIPKDNSLIRSMNSEEPVVSKTGSDFVRLEIKNEPYLFGQFKTQYIVAKSDDGDAIVDTLASQPWGGSQFLEMGAEGDYIIAATSRNGEFPEIVLYLLDEGIIKRTYELECGGRPYGNMRITNATYKSADRQIVFDIDVHCRPSYLLRFDSVEINDVINRATVTATLSDNYFVQSVTTRHEQARRERDMLQLANTQASFEDCRKNGPQVIRTKYPTVENGILYCWHFTKFPKFDHRYNALRNGYQEIAAILVTHENARELILQEFYALTDSALYYTGIPAGKGGRAFDPNANTAIVGRILYPRAGTISGSKAELLIVGTDFLHELRLHCECDDMSPGRHARFNQNTGVLELEVSATSNEIKVNGSNVSIPPAEISQPNSENKSGESTRIVRLEVAFDAEAGSAEVKVVPIE